MDYGTLKYQNTDIKLINSDLNKYSTTEEAIGVWTNGKTIYRKVISFDYFPNNSQRVVSTHINNLEYICWYEYSWYDESDKRFFSGLRFDNNTTFCKVAISHTDLIVEGKGVDWSTRTSNGKCIIYYTKND